MDKELELRMYFLVPYNISPIQQAIQAGHASLEYARNHGNTKLFKDFVDNHKTWIILNGGTTNSKLVDGAKPREDENPYLGTLDNACHQIIASGITYSIFQEPDLNDALTAVCFICDERVFNYEDYPDFMDFLLNVGVLGRFGDDIKLFKKLDKEERKEKYKTHYESWVETLGGEKNVFLRNLLKGKKLA